MALAGVRKGLPKNAREYVPVGLGRAIHGAPRFWESLPHTLSGNIDIASKVSNQIGPIAISVMTEVALRVGCPELYGAMDGGVQASHGCAEGACFGQPTRRATSPKPSG
ncbi:hypothetical protein MARINON1_52130 [Marinobacter salarius]|nr:hypothetical protein MBHK15_110614 [Marinobacter salarius]VXC11867.1 hypothetical protein MARINON1_52130 [Marinobacter salarius]